MRDQIKAVAADLLITNGVRGLRFGDIADRLGITRANVHYHFGTKKNLGDEVIAEYGASTLHEIGLIWRDPDLSYLEKARQMMEFNRARYAKYNSTKRSGRPWSLITRMRYEADQLSDSSRRALRSFTDTIEHYIDDAVVRAQRTGELSPGAPLKDIAVQLIAIVDSAGSITQDGGSFDRLERLYTAYLRIVAHAYGMSARPTKRPRLAANIG
jgi:TetR/AcrR family transcriptional regulator, transcriptional repressor for nem operon